MQPVFVFFFFSLVPSFKTCLGLGKTIFLFGEELMFGSCKCQSVARLYSGGKRVELSTVMVSWHSLLWCSCCQLGFLLGAVIFSLPKVWALVLAAPPPSQVCGRLLFPLATEMVCCLPAFSLGSCVKFRDTFLRSCYRKVPWMLFELKPYPTLFPWAVLFLGGSCWNSCLPAFCIAVMWLV